MKREQAEAEVSKQEVDITNKQAQAQVDRESNGGK